MWQGFAKTQVLKQRLVWVMSTSVTYTDGDSGARDSRKCMPMGSTGSGLITPLVGTASLDLLTGIITSLGAVAEKGEADGRVESGGRHSTTQRAAGKSNSTRTAMPSHARRTGECVTARKRLPTQGRRKIQVVESATAAPHKGAGTRTGSGGVSMKHGVAIEMEGRRMVPPKR